MANLILWKRLYPNDFNAINGDAAPSGTGGGAMHIALGTNNARNDVRSFLGLAISAETKVKTESWPGNHPAGEIIFGLNPARNNEWRIADQRSHRHPAWSTESGFPGTYAPSDPPVAIVIRLGDTFHARWLPMSEFAAIEPGLASRDRGVAEAPPAILRALGLPATTALSEYQEEEARGVDEFDPGNSEDGRKRIFAEILRRQGQSAFRNAVMTSYGGCCAVTGCSAPWVVEAAHISPYRGPNTNHASNGIALRADIHTLFDLGLVTVEPATLKVRVSSLVMEPEYRGLDGRELAVGTVKPSKAALEEHFSRFRP